MMDSKLPFYMGLDWGVARIGIALADSETKLAFSFSVLENNKSIFDHIVEIIAEYNVLAVLIGIPRSIKHSNFEKKIRIFASVLKKKSDVKIIFIDENFTTKMAIASLQQKHGSIRKSGYNDAEAARILLQDWLEMY